MQFIDMQSMSNAAEITGIALHYHAKCNKYLNIEQIEANILNILIKKETYIILV